MMERQGDSQACMMIVDLDEFVPATHLLRQLKRKVDFTFNRNGRFKDGTLFLDVFEGIVEQCKQAGLIQGKAVVTDSTHVKANVNDALRETVTVTKEPSEYFKTLEAAARELETVAD